MPRKLKKKYKRQLPSNPRYRDKNEDGKADKYKKGDKKGQKKVRFTKGMKKNTKKQGGEFTRKEIKKNVEWGVTDKGHEKLQPVKKKRKKHKAKRDKVVARAVKKSGKSGKGIADDGKISKRERKIIKNHGTAKQKRKVRRKTVKVRNKNWKIKKIRRNNSKPYLAGGTGKIGTDKRRNNIRRAPQENEEGYTPPDTGDDNPDTGDDNPDTGGPPKLNDAATWSSRYNKTYDSWWD